MDREPEELQFVGFFGILRVATLLLLSRRGLFAQITLALILPLAIISLAQVHVSHLLLSKIDRNEAALKAAPCKEGILSRRDSEWTAVLLFNAACLVGVLIFTLLSTLLSTSAIVYSVASIYAAKDLSFRRVLSVVHRVCKRLMFTYICSFLLFLGYTVATVFLVVACVLLLGLGTAGTVALVVLTLAYLAGTGWINALWHVASMVSLLEGASGMGAMRKSWALMQGKLRVAVGIAFLLNLFFAMYEAAYSDLLAEGRGWWGSRAEYAWVARAVIAVLLLYVLTSLTLLILIGLVAQTAVYFVCKLYHGETVEKLSLAEHLELLDRGAAPPER